MKIPATMRALRKSRPEPGLDLVEAPVPSFGPEDVLIRVAKTAICGTDVHIYDWDEWSSRTVPAPMIIGHEYAGTVAAVGAAVSGLEPGDRVTGEGHIACGLCRNCRAGRSHLCRGTVGVGVNRQGCFAEYLCIPARNAFKLGPEIPDEIASIFDPFGNAVHAALSFDVAGEDVLITGAGPIGVMAAAVCRRAGARRVVATDVNPNRLGLARLMGADRCVDARTGGLQAAMAELGMKEGFDVGLEMSGNAAAQAEMFRSMRNGGKVALLGLPAGPVEVAWSDVIFKGLTLKGIYGREMFETWHKMSALVGGGLDLSPVITHRLKASDYRTGFAAMKNGDSCKVVLDWGAA